MSYSDLHFNNVQLMKLVTSAEILFQHLYDLVSVDNKVFIDQWFCYKQEYDETCTSAQFDVNENVQECSVLARIDEVSENEKISSVSSASTKSSTPSEKVDQLNENTPSFVSKDDEKNFHADVEMAKEMVNLSQLDSDLLEYMTDFKLFTDGNVSDWFKTLYFNTSEIKQYMNWLESKDYKKIWVDIYANARRESNVNRIKYDALESTVNQTEEDVERRFIPIEGSQKLDSQVTEISNVLKGNPTNCINLNLHQEEVVDQDIRYLQEIRKVLLCIKQEANNKFKNKDELHSSAEFHSFLKVDVAFEIIDLSIEMKNQLKLGRDIQDLTTFNDKVDTVVADCFRILTLNEIRHLLFTYLNNVTAMRKCSSEHDKQVSELDREISNQKFLIWRLYMIINENKRSYESRCLTLHKEFEQKLQLIGKTTTDESNDESVAGVPGRALLPIMEKNSLQESTQSESRDTQNAMYCVPHIPEKNLRTLQSTSASSSNTRVKRNKKKLIIMSQKH